ncbi:MAG: hypothetical protein ABSF15_00055 [Candidatus Sulfotelmatobacter sp.]|jgi:DNA-binding response OmpR family regulator
MRILIAEDDAALANFVRPGSQGEPYTVDVAEDGEQARNMGSEVDSDLVILNLNLPVWMEWWCCATFGCDGRLCRCWC